MERRKTALCGSSQLSSLPEKRQTAQRRNFSPRCPISTCLTAAQREKKLIDRRKNISHSAGSLALLSCGARRRGIPANGEDSGVLLVRKLISAVPFARLQISH